ncbi:type II secretion system F family protein [Actinoplanes sp. NPDC051475]|uniref:type II secretion system F family protein n=1 Tax=Actinoplanes sp. NPDC051475 TaxID=3157225 RepID=UPI00344EF135
MTSEQLLLACAALGITTGAGLLLIATAVFGRPGTTDPDTDAPPSSSPSSLTTRLAVWRQPGGGRRLAAAIAAALAVGGLTGWPVGGILAAVLAWWLPQLVGPDHAHTRELARIEAIATWTESLRDTLSGAAGLEQAVLATARRAPAAIRDEVTRLATRIERGTRLPDALTAFARDLEDPTGDLVVAALVMAAERSARQLTDLLGLLSATAREQASLRLRVAAGRARVRTAVRVIVTVTMAMAAGLAYLNRDYLTPYDSMLGQLMLLVVGGVFAGSFAWLRRMSAIESAPRVLSGLDVLTMRRAGVQP